MWKCACCGENSDEPFDACWNCGTTREGVNDSSFQRADEPEFDDEHWKPQESRPSVQVVGDELGAQRPIAPWTSRLVNSLVDDVFIQILVLPLVGMSLGLSLTVLSVLTTSLRFEIPVWFGWVVGIGTWVGYFVATEFLWQKTLGKLITGTTVINEDGSRPSFRQILIRSISRLIPFEALSFLSKHPVGWHDSLSGTRVVSSAILPVTSMEPTAQPQLRQQSPADRPHVAASPLQRILRTAVALAVLLPLVAACLWGLTVYSESAKIRRDRTQREDNANRHLHRQRSAPTHRGEIESSFNWDTDVPIDDQERLEAYVKMLLAGPSAESLQAYARLVELGAASIPYVTASLDDEAERLRHWGTAPGNRIPPIFNLAKELRMDFDDQTLNEALQRLTRHDEETTRAWASFALSSNGRWSVPPRPDHVEPRPIAFWLTNVQHDDRVVRLWALHHLGMVPEADEVVVEELADALQDEDAVVRIEAVKSLAKLGPKARSSAPQLRTLLDTADLNSLIEIALALYRVSGESKESVTALSNTLSESRPVPFQIQALQALGEISESGAIESIADATSHDDPKLRVAAVSVAARQLQSFEGDLSDHGDAVRAARSALTHALEGDPTIRLVASQGLYILLHRLRDESADDLFVETREAVVPALIEFIDTDDWRYRNNVAAILRIGKSADSAAITQLISILADADVSEDLHRRASFQSARALSSLGPKPPKELLAFRSFVAADRDWNNRLSETELRDAPWLETHLKEASGRPMGKTEFFRLFTEHLQEPPTREMQGKHWALDMTADKARVFIPTLYYSHDQPITLELWCVGMGAAIGNWQGSGLGLRAFGKQASFSAHDTHEYRFIGTDMPWDASFGPVHIAGTFDGNQMTLFVNGQRVSTAKMERHRESSLPIMIGGNPQPSSPPGREIWQGEFSGMLDEVRISSRVRYVDNFAPQRHFESDADTIALYHFDTGRASLAVDASGNGHHGQIWDAEWISEDTLNATVSNVWGVDKRDEQANPRLLDLSAFYNGNFDRTWHGYLKGNNLAELPRGIQELDGVKFDMRGLIQLSREGQQPFQFPSNVVGIPCSGKARRIHFLHGAIHNVLPAGTAIGTYVLRYADGQSEERPLLVGKDVLDWHTTPPQSLGSDTTVAWSGQNAYTRAQGRSIQLYRTRWENPRPNAEIVGIDLVSAKQEVAPFVVAITVE